MKSSAKKIELASVDDLFSTEEGRQDAKLEKIQEIPLSELHPFKNHPFKVKDDEAMMETADSIKQYGVLVPAIARPDPEGGYELVAGHRRHRASELAEKETMPVIVRDLDDDAATIIMVDSNLQRESLLPSERAFAYKMKLDAMKRQAGRPSKENVSQVGTQKRSDQLLAEQVGQSRNQIQRYIRLTELIPELMDMVDEKKIALNPAYELSFLKKEEQVDLLDAMDSEQATPSLSQAQRLKKYSQEGHLTLDMMRVIMGEEKKSDLDRVTFTSDTLRKYFPKSYTPQRMQETIIKLGRVYIKQQLPIFHRIGFQTTGGDNTICNHLIEHGGIAVGRFLEVDIAVGLGGINILIGVSSSTHSRMCSRSARAKRFSEIFPMLPSFIFVPKMVDSTAPIWDLPSPPLPLITIMR